MSVRSRIIYWLSMTEVILASKSPRRQELLRNLINHFIVISSEIDETAREDEKPADFVVRLAKEKALRVGDRIGRSGMLDSLVIAADTIVVDGNEILGKPRDGEDARRILEQLRNKTHLVFSGIALYQVASGAFRTRVVRSEVSMRDYSPAEIQAYVQSGDAFDKAGAYAIQNRSFDPAPEFGDCYANVMGLPLCDLYVLMKSMGLKGKESVAENCQNSIQYQCPVYNQRLVSEQI
jgi:septum formation protein